MLTHSPYLPPCAPPPLALTTSPSSKNRTEYKYY